MTDNKEVEQIFSLSNFSLDEDVSIESVDKIFKPSEIVMELDKYVVGQADAKKLLAVTLTNHSHIIRHNEENPNGLQLSKTNIMLAGPSGSGKTLLVNTVANTLGYHVLNVDATEYSETGYVGKGVDTILEDLIRVCDNDLDRINKSIIFIDEIDKICDKGDRVSGQGVQRSLLKLIEGTKSQVDAGGSKFESNKMEIDTSKILFIFGGAFTKFTSDSKETIDKKPLGFGAETLDDTKKFKLDHVSIIKAGLLNELVGRIGHIVELQSLTEEDYKRILTEPIDSVYKQYVKLGELRGLDLELTEDEINSVAKEAMTIGTGARSLRPLAEKLLLDKMYV